MIHLSIVLLTMKKLKRSNLKRYWCFQAQNPGVLTTKAASEVGEGWGVDVQSLGGEWSPSWVGTDQTLVLGDSHRVAAGLAILQWLPRALGGKYKFLLAAWEVCVIGPRGPSLKQHIPHLSLMFPHAGLLPFSQHF